MFVLFISPVEYSDVTWDVIHYTLKSDEQEPFLGV